MVVLTMKIVKEDIWKSQMCKRVQEAITYDPDFSRSRLRLEYAIPFSIAFKALH